MRAAPNAPSDFAKGLVYELKSGQRSERSPKLHGTCSHFLFKLLLNLPSRTLTVRRYRSYFVATGVFWRALASYAHVCEIIDLFRGAAEEVTIIIDSEQKRHVRV